MFSNASTPRGGPPAEDGKGAAAAAAAAMGAPRCAASCASSCSTGSEPLSTPLASQQDSVTQTVPASPSTPASAPTSGAFNTFSAAKKTLGRLLGAGSGAPWSADGSGTPAQSPTTGSGLIAAFRAIIPNTSNGSSDSNGADTGSPQHQQPVVAAPAPAPVPAPVAAPAPMAAPVRPPVTATGKSQLLALCPTLPPSMQRAEWCLDDYIVLEKLYKGYASVVYKGICKRSREVVVLKSYTLSSICELYQHQIFREVRLHSSLQHENIVKLYAAFKEGDRVVLIQEYADGGDLFSLLQKYGGRLGEKVAVQLVLEPFLRVLQYLHTRSIVHRDIKPENILFTKGSVLKLADFGLAIDLREERAVTRAGTLDYMAPEILKCPYKSKPEENKEKEHLHYGNTVDSWAVGVMTFELLTGCPPFYDQSRTNTEARIKSGVPAFPPTMSDGARSFIATALNKDPIMRPSTLDMLHHSWVDAFRARRSLRVIPDAPAADSTLPAPPASARAPGAPAAIPGPIVKPNVALQAVEAMLNTDRAAAALHGSGIAHSAASSPCLGARAPAPLLHKAIAAAAAAGQQQQQQQQLDGSVQLTPPVPMEM